jgi:hypothetical protein
MKMYLRKKLHPISTVVGRLRKFLLLKIPKRNMKAGRFKILSEKMRKNDFFKGFLNFFGNFFYFLAIFKFLYYF